MGFLDKIRKRKIKPPDKFDEKNYPGITEAIKANKEVVITIKSTESSEKKQDSIKSGPRKRLPKIRNKPNSNFDSERFTEEIDSTQESYNPVNVFKDEEQLERILANSKQGKIDQESDEFEEPEAQTQNAIPLDDVTMKHLLTIMFKPDPRTLKLVTNTPPRQFDPIVIGSTFNRVAKGEHKGLNAPTVFDIVMDERDIRAPSLRGDSRHELVAIKSQDSSNDESGPGRQPW